MAEVQEPADASARRLAAAWTCAARAGDDDWFRRHLHPDFRYLNAAGGVMSREQMLARPPAAGGEDSRNEYELREVEGRRYGELLIVIGRYFGRGRIPDSAPVGQVLREKYARGIEARFSQIWRTQGGEWRCLLLQATEIA